MWFDSFCFRRTVRGVRLNYKSYKLSVWTPTVKLKKKKIFSPFTQRSHTRHPDQLCWLGSILSFTAYEKLVCFEYFWSENRRLRSFQFWDHDGYSRTTWVNKILPKTRQKIVVIHKLSKPMGNLCYSTCKLQNLEFNEGRARNRWIITVTPDGHRQAKPIKMQLVCVICQILIVQWVFEYWVTLSGHPKNRFKTLQRFGQCTFLKKNYFMSFGIHLLLVVICVDIIILYT